MLDLATSELRPMLEEDFLTKEEEQVLKKIRNKKLGFLASTYVSLTALLIYAGFRGVARGPYGYRYGHTWGPDDVTRAQKLVPFFIGFLFLLLTIYFYNYFRKTVQPLIKDLRKGIKQKHFFPPGRYMPPLVAEYYLKTPLEKIPLIRVDKDFYNSIHPGSLACISYAPYSKFVLSVEVDRKKINFNYSVKMDDI